MRAQLQATGGVPPPPPSPPLPHPHPLGPAAAACVQGRALPLGALVGPKGSAGLGRGWLSFGREQRMDLVTVEEFERVVDEYVLNDVDRQAVCEVPEGGGQDG